MSAYFIDDLESGLRHLNQLMSVICEIHYDRPKGEYDERIDGLLWIARDLAEGIYSLQEKKDQERASIIGGRTQ